ncbi:DUF7839 domain-containing protein [Halorubrum lacusprofundi]|jgi:putative transcriptional regulator|uniref:Regulatory protein Crp n=1 Tax=Halorubrum lacusprofundi (strain ATCC 49239 / DSM 5036 / JCM 8891 / ACAM 34) TaxID=416348 RepID=B9LQM7_HALLT|nr:MarR family transcriptional regulator [Halorubrum lacusprofundi]ACM55629.1 regulatory protein Crp [Halorubrum lacusprofundi ATCC 49239]MCG1007097.1 MarR family transcriptional regulator [Halorubrum lacusprofundi]
MTDSDRATPPEVLDSKRDATRYQVLVEIAARQPAVSQTEIAEAIGVTSQAVSDYVRDLVEHEYVEKEGRGRYTVTKEGVDWLISRTDSLEAYLNRVSSDVLGSVDVDAAIAMDDIAEGSDVGLLMRNGVLHANPAGGTATAVTVTAAAAGEAVGVADFEGVVDYETGYVTVLPVPAVTDAASVAPDVLTATRPSESLLAVAGTEAYALAARADAHPDIRFGTVDAVAEAAVRGMNVLLIVTADQLPKHTARLRDENIPHEVLDAGDF